MRRRITTSCVVAVALAACMAGCNVKSGPLQVSRTTLGTAVLVTVYGDHGDPEAAVERAFAEMDNVSADLDAYSPVTPIAQFNEQPYAATPLPSSALEVFDAVERLGVGSSFSAALFGVSALYGFESSETVPTAMQLNDALIAAHSLVLEGDTARFSTPTEGGTLPGLDFGGAAKGIGLDRALNQLRDAGVTSAIISAGSTTVTLGERADGGPWRIGIEDPREGQRVVAVVEADGACTVSTSGDYQRYFEIGGVRYHHILDPATGAPARGLRSLTVFGPRDTLSGLDADILSTALFVMGAQSAESYARAAGLGLYMVDDEGRALIVPAPEECGVSLVTEAEPIR
jgi:thiamine biosynthesis lipoprotein